MQVGFNKKTNKFVSISFSSLKIFFSSIVKTLLLCLLVFVGLSSNSLWAQSSDRTANAVLLKAQRMVVKKEYKRAESYLRRSINKVRDKEALWLELGQLAMLQLKYADAASYFKMAYYAKDRNKQRYGLMLVDALVKANDWANAAYYLNAEYEDPSWTQEKKILYRRLKSMVEHSELYTKNTHSNLQVQNAGPALNDQHDAYLPFLAQGDSLIFFTIKKGLEEKIYYSYKDYCNEYWDAPTLMDAPLNTLLSESALFQSYNGKYLLFMRCQNSTERNNNQGGCDLCFAHEAAKGWQVSDPFGLHVNSPAYEGMPTMDPKNQTVYFVSNRQGGYGGMDIWKIEFINNQWTMPENLGPNINTPGDETAPYIAADGKTLYFSSDGHPGLGGQDIFISKKEGNGWTVPLNLGAPINSQFDDFGLTISSSGNKAYFSSNRPGGYGGFDLYEFEMPLRYMYEPTIFYTGIVADSIKKEIIPNATIELFDQEGNKIGQTHSNAGDASYFLAVPYRGSYAVNVYRFGYPDREVMLEAIADKFFVHQNLMLITQSDLDYLATQVVEEPEEEEDFDLEPIRIRVKIDFRSYFEFDLSDLWKR